MAPLSPPAAAPKPRARFANHLFSDTSVTTWVRPGSYLDPHPCSGLSCSFAHPSIPPSSPAAWASRWRRWHAWPSPSRAARSCVSPESRHPCHLPRDLLNRSTNQPRSLTASSSNRPRQHDARLPHTPWPLPPCTPTG